MACIWQEASSTRLYQRSLQLSAALPVFSGSLPPGRYTGYAVKPSAPQCVVYVEGPERPVQYLSCPHTSSAMDSTDECFWRQMYHHRSPLPAASSSSTTTTSAAYLNAVLDAGRFVWVSMQAANIEDGPSLAQKSGAGLAVFKYTLAGWHLKRRRLGIQ